MNKYGEGVAAERRLLLSIEGRHGDPTTWVEMRIPNDILLTMPWDDLAARYFKPAFLTLKMKMSQEAAS